MKADAAASSASIRDYMQYRREQGASNASINRELSIMQSAYSLAYKETPRRVAAKLYFDRLPESKPRQGFVEEEQYRVLAAKCTDSYLRAMLALAYNFGFRRGELLTLRVSDCDLLNGAIRLRTSKNGEPRTVPLTTETQGLLGSCIARKPPEAPAFTRNGKIVSDFRGTWAALCCAAGLGKMLCSKCRKPVEKDKCENCKGRTRLLYRGLLFHDLRRSAVRNMVRRGVPEVVAMRISGHKTRSVFDRYNVTSERDLVEAAKRIESVSLSYSLVKEVEGEDETKAVQNVTIQ